MPNPISTNELEARLQKVENIRARDGVVWKDKFKRTHAIDAARGLDDGAAVKIAGRITALRWLGKLMFGRLYDIDGEIQFSMSREEIGEEDYKFMKANVDMGDFIGITGELYHTTAGELTVKVSKYEILAKALRPLPEKFHGLTDTETRYRQRYLDIISNPETRRTMRIRFQMLHFIRNFLEQNGFVEVETPILKNVSSGAAAKPFTTHHNALDADLFLRIAPELPLKECIAAGFDRVFEMGKNFRNEGMDAAHLQEFTMLEWYAAYWDYNDNIDFSWRMIQEMLMAVRGTLQIECQGTMLDFSKYEKLDYTARMNKLLQTDILAFDDAEKLKKHIVSIGLFPAGELRDLKSLFAVVDYVFKRKIRDQIIQPAITYNYPTFTRPLARRNDQDSRRVDNFQLIAMGAELINAYSELVDPIEQRKSFEEQMENKAAGDDESFDLDEDFMLAMEHGMPPTSGLGFGFDRWVSIIADQPTLRDVILFPIMK
ncbi:MAG: lysine--tRNA ligase [Rickettsiales bacterium]|jgi:lysyl-tRNA synthetase class 2|nr:lysine--tRNA ligase [Rickettsiales bacterium]